MAYKKDVRLILNDTWDLIIAFPPCTYLTRAGSCNLFNKDHTIKNYSRFKKGLEAVEFFKLFLYSKCPKVAIENPTPLKIFGLPNPNCVVQPFEFGHPFSKRTCLWLKNLPPLIPTEAIFYNYENTTTAKWFNRGNRKFNRAKNRSKTFPGIAEAMAQQWG